MIKICLALLLLLTSNILFAQHNIMPEINRIESQWAKIYYSESANKEASYSSLLKDTQTLVKKYPQAVEPMIWKALIILTSAEFESPFTALDSVNTAKKILEKAIQQQPNTLDGVAFVILGTLYYMTPGWPISFGDEDRAEELLKQGLVINPQSIDAHYFYADYLLSRDETKKAQKYLRLALKIPNRPEQQYADNQLKQEALTVLKNTEESHMMSARKNHFLSLFSTAWSK
jgi:tetratricopeptide (TPR) repeat protein